MLAGSEPRQSQILRPGNHQWPAFPDDWQGNLITNDFRGHRVCRYVADAGGSGLRPQEMPNLSKRITRRFGRLT